MKTLNLFLILLLLVSARAQADAQAPAQNQVQFEPLDPSLAAPPSASPTKSTEQEFTRTEREEILQSALLSKVSAKNIEKMDELDRDLFLYRVSAKKVPALLKLYPWLTEAETKSILFRIKNREHK
jgi:hypothetical protein